MENRTHFETQCNLSFSVAVQAHRLTYSNDYVHKGTNSQLLHSDAEFSHDLQPNFVGEC